MNVKEIMTKKLIFLSPEDTAFDAMQKLTKEKKGGLPVIDEQKKISGMFTEKEIIRTLLPGYIDKVGTFTYEENPKIVKKKMAELCNIKVKDLMSKDVVTIDEDKTLCEIARIMLTQQTRRIVVLDKESKVVGIVSRGDILKALNQEASLCM